MSVVVWVSRRKTVVSTAWLFALLLFLGGLLSAPSVLAQERRTALVIGNSDYHIAPLANPVNDATDMAATLERLGFQVDLRLNLDRKGMRAAIREFGNKLKQGGVGLFYYAGHGVQVEGRNYLVPLGTEIRAADEVVDEAIDAGLVMRKMESAGNPVNIVILDACRDNPFVRDFRSLERGLAKMEGPLGSLIAYATAPGDTALDGEGRNGLYTKHLLTAMTEPGLSIEQVFKRVRNGVRRETGGEQIPWEESSLTGDFYFIPPSEDAPATAATPPPPPVGHLQVISGRPGSRITVNGVERGRADADGIFNLTNLQTASVEVTVTTGEGSWTKTANLLPGQWTQLRFSPAPLPVKQPTGRSSADSASAYCPSEGTGLLLIQGFTRRQDGRRQSFTNPPELTAVLRAVFAEEGMNLQDPGPERAGKIFRRLQNERAKFMQTAHEEHISSLVLIRLAAHQMPIEAVRTKMHKLDISATMEVVDIRHKKSAAIRHRGFVIPSFSFLDGLYETFPRKLRAEVRELVKTAAAGCAGYRESSSGEGGNRGLSSHDAADPFPARKAPPARAGKFPDFYYSSLGSGHRRRPSPKSPSSVRGKHFSR